MTPNSKGEESHPRKWKSCEGASTSSKQSKTHPSSTSVGRNLSSFKFPMEEDSKFLLISNELECLVNCHSCLMWLISADSHRTFSTLMTDLGHKFGCAQIHLFV